MTETRSRRPLAPATGLSPSAIPPPPRSVERTSPPTDKAQPLDREPSPFVQRPRSTRTVSTAISLAVDLDTWWKVECQVRQTTRVGLLLGAVRSDEPAISAAVSDYQRPDGPFIYPVRRPTRRQVSLRLPREDLAALDLLVARHGARTRSEFVAAILAAVRRGELARAER